MNIFRRSLKFKYQFRTYFTQSEQPSRHSLSNNTLKQRLQSNQPLVGMHTTMFGDTSHVEQTAMLGYDFLFAEAEHSVASPESIERLIIAAERRGLPTLVRVGYGYQNIIGHIQKYLTSGAQGIILPQVESARDVELLVEAVKFPPIGKRGLAGDRWNSWGLGEGGDMQQRVEDCNNNSIIGVMIENQKGFDNLDAILKVEHLDFVSFGPTDISADLGVHGEIRHPDVVAMIEEGGKKIRAAGKATGTLVLNQEDYKYWREQDFQVMYCVAQHIFVQGAQELKNGMEDYEKNRKK